MRKIFCENGNENSLKNNDFSAKLKYGICEVEMQKCGNSIAENEKNIFLKLFYFRRF